MVLYIDWDWDKVDMYLKAVIENPFSILHEKLLSQVKCYKNQNTASKISSKEILSNEGHTIAWLYDRNVRAPLKRLHKMYSSATNKDNPFILFRRQQRRQL